MAPILLKIKGNKSFSPFSNLDSEEELSKTWRVCTKVKDSLENGSRLENLSWRLWFLHHLLVDDTKSKSHFKKLSSNTTRQLEGEKGTALSQLPAPKKFNFANGKDGGASAIRQRQMQKEKEATKHVSESAKVRKSVTNTARSLVSDAMFGKNNLSTINFTAPSQHNRADQATTSRKAAKMYQNQSASSASSKMPSQRSQQNVQMEQQPQHKTPVIANQPRQQYGYQQPPLYSDYGLQNYNLQQQQQQMRQVTENFVLHQYTSDQADNQVVELEDIFGPFDMHALLSSDPTQLPTVELPFDAILADPNNFSPLSSGAPSPNYGTPPMANANAGQNSYFYKDNSVVYPSLQSSSTGQQGPQAGSAMHIPNSGRSMAMNTVSSGSTSPIGHPSVQRSSQPGQNSKDGYNTMQQTNHLSSTGNNHSNQQNALYVPSTMPPPPSGGLPQSNIVSNSSASQGSSHNDRYGLGPKNMTSKSGNSMYDLMYIDTTSANAASDFHNSSFTQQHARNSSLSAPTTPLSTIPPSMNNVQSSGQMQNVMMNHVHQQVQPMSAPSSRSGSRASSPSAENKQAINKRVGGTRPPLASASVSSDGEGGSRSMCSNCGATSTPLWRRSANDELLCNACGLYLKLHNAPRPKSLKPHVTRKDAKGEEDIVQPVCSNCNTTTTPLWRRDDDGSPLCNACGLYLKLHHEKRPLSMKTDIIKKRQRYESGPAAPKGKSGRKAKQEDGEPSRMSPPEINEDIDPSGNRLEEDDDDDDDMDYKFQQYPQNNNNNQNSGSGNNMMMTGY